MARYICVISGKGGVGKTTSAINLAHAMGKHRKTLLVDANLSTPNVHFHLGSPLLRKTLMHALKGEASIKEVIYSHESGLRVLPSITTAQDLKSMKYSKVKQTLRALEEEADIIMLDTSGGITRDSMIVMEACDEVLVITNPELSAVLDAQKALQLAHELGKTILGVVVNKYKEHKQELKLSEVERLLNLPVIGIIPYDNQVKHALRLKHPVTYSHPRSKASKSYEELAGLLLGQAYFESISKKSNRMYDYVLRRLGFA